MGALGSHLNVLRFQYCVHSDIHVWYFSLEYTCTEYDGLIIIYKYEFLYTMYL